MAARLPPPPTKAEIAEEMIIAARRAHNGRTGTIANYMRDRTDELYDEWMDDSLSEEKALQLQGKVEGACEMMAILTETNEDLQWDCTEARYQERQRQIARDKRISDTTTSDSGISGG